MKSGQNGQSMFEVLVAMGIMALIMTAVVSLATRSISNSAFSRNETLANRYAQEAIEWVRGQRETQGYDFVRNNATNGGKVWCLQSTNWNNEGTCNDEFVGNTIFVREMTLIRDDSANEVQVNIEVSWGEGNRVFTVQNQTVLADLRSQ